MNLLRNGLLMPKTGDRWRTELTEKFAFLYGFSAEFISRSKPDALDAEVLARFAQAIRLVSDQRSPSKIGRLA
jgi:hypothetical protein